MAKKKSKQPTSTISFRSKQERSEAIRKSKVRHASLSHLARNLFNDYNP